MNLPLRALLLSAAVAVLLTSCTRWHTADRLRDPYVTYTGADIYHPVDGKIHYDPKKLKDGVIREAYVVVNEITYNRRSRISNTDDFYPGKPFADNFKPTGRQLVAKIGSHGFRKRLSKLPDGLASIPAPTEDSKRGAEGVFRYWRPESAPSFYTFQWGGGGTTLDKEKIARDRRECCTLGSFASPRVEQPGWWRRQAIGVCDYAVDPMLNVISFPVEVVSAVIFVPLGELWYMIDSSFSQKAERTVPQS